MTTHVEAAIERYFEGQISEIGERDALFGHLDRCGGCRQRFDEMARVQRALSNSAELPQAELALIGRTVIANAARAKQETQEKASPWLAFSRIFAPILAVGLAVFIFMRPAEYGSKGGGETNAIAIEALCFNEHGEQTAVLKKDGSCAAPALVKLVYASPRTVDRLHVKAKTIDVELEKPAPRSSIPGHFELAAGEVVEVVGIAGEQSARLRIEGAEGAKP